MSSNEYFWLFWRGWTRDYWPGNARPYVVIFTDSRACLKFTGLGMLACVRFFSPTLVRAREVNRCWNARPGAVVITDFCACLLATPGLICSPGCSCYHRPPCVPNSSNGIDMLARVLHFSSRCRVVVVALSSSRCCRHDIVVALLSSRCCRRCRRRRVVVVVVALSSSRCRRVVVVVPL